MKNKKTCLYCDKKDVCMYKSSVFRFFFSLGEMRFFNEISNDKEKLEAAREKEDDFQDELLNLVASNCMHYK